MGKRHSDPPTSTIARPEKRVALGQLLRQLTFAGLAAKGSVPQWWQACEEYHRNEFHESDSPGPGVPPLSIPFSQPRLDMLTSQVCSVIGKQDPYMLSEHITGDDDVEEKLETLLHKFWKAADFESKIRKGSRIATDTNLVWYRVAWQRTSAKPFGGLIWDVLHPKDVVIFPAGPEGIEGASITGHRFYRRYRDVIALQKNGTYFADAVVIGGQSPADHDDTGEIRNSGASPSAGSPDKNDRRVAMWQLVFKYSESEDEPEKWYAATITEETGELLACSDYPYSRPWYFDAGYIVENNEAYYPGVSVGRHLSALQDATNKTSSMLYGGGMMSAYPPVFGPELPEKDFRYGPGQYIPADMPAQNWSPTVRFNGQTLQEQWQAYQQIGDQTARISANTMGASQARDTTATENSIIAAGVSVGLEEYIAEFGGPLGDVAEFTIELLQRHFGDWKVEAQVMGITPELLAEPALWEPNGKTPGNTPGAKLAACQKVVELFTAVAGMPVGQPNATGIDIYELTKIILLNSGLAGSDNIQIAKPKLEAMAPPPAPPMPPGMPPGGMPPPGMMPPGQEAPLGGALVGPPQGVPPPMPPMAGMNPPPAGPPTQGVQSGPPPQISPQDLAALAALAQQGQAH